MAKKSNTITKRYNKTEILDALAEKAEISRKQAGAVLEGLGDLIEGHIKKKACGEFVLPGLLKVVTKHKPATKAKKGVPNPFKPGELMDVKAKPAKTIVKINALKKIKDMV